MSEDVLVGGDILRLITVGMYDKPLNIYREYLQNAIDSLANFGYSTEAVQVTIDPIQSRIVIRDYGTGLSPEDSVRRLIPIGNSKKIPGLDRGRLGIGRLAALAFAEDVHFTTRTKASEPVTRVSWNGNALRSAASADARTVISNCTTVRSLKNDGWPDRFFQVDIDGVTRHSASTLLNHEAVRNYIGEVCPVPMSPSFPLADAIQRFLGPYTNCFTINVTLNDSDTPVTRPFGQAIPLAGDYSAPFEMLETRLVPKLNSHSPAAVIWLAHTPYVGSISRGLSIRGLRARIGNIQIGSENIFEHLFHETRFNGWCVGEVHIVDSSIVPNARRDYFEICPHLRNLENHIGAVAHDISAKCRRASSQRNMLRGVGTNINRAKCACDLVTSGYLHPEDADVLRSRQRVSLRKIKQTVQQLNGGSPLVKTHELDQYEHILGSVDLLRKPPPDMPSGSANSLRSAFGTIADSMPPDTALAMIKKILLRVNRNRRGDSA